MGGRAGYKLGDAAAEMLATAEDSTLKPKARTVGEAAKAAQATAQSPWKLRIAKAVLVSTGVWWGLCMQLIYYGGAGHPLAQLPNLDWYLGMMLVYCGRLFYGRDARYADASQLHILPIAVCDFLGTVGTTIGLEMAGSAIFGIIFASVTVWSALFTWLLLSKPQTKVQMAGILAVVCGLALPALERSNPEDAQDEWEVHVGIALTSVGTLFYSIEYVLCERIYHLYDSPIDAKQLCFYTGAWGLGFSAAWVGAYTLPRWDQLVVREVAIAGGSPYLLLFLYATHMINNAAHNLSWFIVCELEGGVSTGLLMGLKAAALFFFSALFFCSTDHQEQCLTTYKLGGTAIVLTGTAVYYGGCVSCPSLFFFSRRSRESRVRLRDDKAAHLGAEILDELSPAIGGPPTPSELEAGHVSLGRAAFSNGLARGGGGRGNAGPGCGAVAAAGCNGGDASSRVASLEQELADMREMLERERELRKKVEGSERQVRDSPGAPSLNMRDMMGRQLRQKLEGSVCTAVQSRAKPASLCWPRLLAACACGYANAPLPAVPRRRCAAIVRRTPCSTARAPAS